MENYIVSARKYRPQVFDEVVGQQHVTNTLFKAIESNHLAQALLFTGPRGVGKTTSARILAKMINASENDDPNQDFSFNIFELDAASNNSVDDIRNLIDQVRFAPQVGRYKVYIIDEVHMLSQAAFNAFLKTLEEPPKHAIFILATTEKHKIIPTILSRCQIYDFKRISVDDIMGHLKNVAAKEGVSADDAALRIIAQKADGALRDALSIFDRIVSFSGEHVSYQDVIENLRILDYEYYFRTIDLVSQDDQAGLLNIFNEVLENGFDGHLYLGGLASHCRDLLVCQDQRTLNLLEVGEEIKERYHQQAQAVNVDFLMAALKTLSEADVRYKSSNNSRLLVELSLLELSRHWQETSGQKKKPSPSLAQSPAPKVPQNQAKSSPKPEPPAQPKATAEPSLEEKTAPQETQAPSPATQIKENPSPDQAAANPKPTQAKAAPSAGETKSEADTPSEAWTAKNPKPLGIKRKGNSLSISATLQGQNLSEEKEEESEEDLDAPVAGKPQENFDLDALQKVWNQFVEKARANSQRVVVATLADKDLAIKDNFEVEVTLDNTIQEQAFSEVKRDLLYFCRENLQNFALHFSIKIVKGSQKLDPYSAQEKYQYLLEKNQHLSSLKEKLNLDLE